MRSKQIKSMTKEEIIGEILFCHSSPAYFIENYVMIEDMVNKEWIPFNLWESQKEVLYQFNTHQLNIALKSRQLGISWLSVAFACWVMIFQPVAKVGLFSKRDVEAVDLLSKLKNIIKRLPKEIFGRSCAFGDLNNAHSLSLNNGSSCIAFPTTGGDSYTLSLVVADEFDLVIEQNKFMASVKPTIDAGGRMIIVSRVDKSRPDTQFKNIYLGAKAKKNSWNHIFIPWYGRPTRDQSWYDEIKKDSIQRTGSLDEVFEQYPSTDIEALAEKSTDKRIPAHYITRAFMEKAPIEHNIGIPLLVYQLPSVGMNYCLGADTAEGQVKSDDSSAVVVDQYGNEVASIAGKLEPSVFGHVISVICGYYNCPAMIERNNHGHAVMLWLREVAVYDKRVHQVELLKGHDDKPGWLSSTIGKALMYTTATKYLSLENNINEPIHIHTEKLSSQLLSIVKSNLRAPSGKMDDMADAYAIALCGLGSSSYNITRKTTRIVKIRPSNFIRHGKYLRKV